MKKAVIVGGSNGIGLAIARNLADKGYQVCILDRVAPQETALPIPKTIPITTAICWILMKSCSKNSVRMQMCSC